MNITTAVSVPEDLRTQLVDTLNWQHFSCIDSTNDYLLQKEQAGNQLCSADSQTCGRGRRQQHWADEGKSALFSLSMNYSPQIDISAWPVQVAITLAQTLNTLLAEKNHTNRPTIFIKWPNDLYLKHNKQWGKCAGILIENSIGRQAKVVTGIGINLSPLSQHHAIDYPTTHLDLSIASQQLIVILANALFCRWQQFLKNPQVDPQSYQSLDYLWQKKIIVQHPETHQQSQGLAMGINARGHLLLQKEGQLTTITSQQRIRLSAPLD